MPHHITTSRLALRPVVPDDEAPVLAVLNDFAVSGWLARVPFPYSRRDFHDFLHGFARPGETFAVEDGRGFVGIVTGGAELGYWFAPWAQGLGYATEASAVILAEWFGARGGDVVSGYFDGNIRSARVLEKLGFLEAGRDLLFSHSTGTERPHVSLRLTFEDFVMRVT